jgi:hypothetical protein
MANRLLVAPFVLVVLCGWAGPHSSKGAAEETGGRATVSESEMSAEDRGAAEARPTASARKKGIGHWATGAKEHPLDPKVIDELGCGWYYNWGPRPRPGEEEVEAEFVPMIWDERSVTDEVLAQVKAGGYSALLGFNEPDNKGQADMSVELAIELWPRLMATGLRLGSPGTCQGAKWLDDFMEEADRRGYRVDFICLHWYDDITKADAVDNLRRYLTGYWEKYQLPIWLTEYSGADWKWNERGPVTFEDNARFARESVAMLESLPFVQRYAWFSSSKTRGIYATVGLYETADEITIVGEAYRDADKPAEATAEK